MLLWALPNRRRHVTSESAQTKSAGALARAGKPPACRLTIVTSEWHIRDESEVNHSDSLAAVDSERRQPVTGGKPGEFQNLGLLELIGYKTRTCARLADKWRSLKKRIHVGRFKTWGRKAVM